MRDTEKGRYTETNITESEKGKQRVTKIETERQRNQERDREVEKQTSTNIICQKSNQKKDKKK